MTGVTKVLVQRFTQSLRKIVINYHETDGIISIKVKVYVINLYSRVSGRLIFVNSCKGEFVLKY